MREIKPSTIVFLSEDIHARSTWRRVIRRKKMVGYYTARKVELLRDLDHTFALMHPTLTDRYGEKTALQMQEDIRSEFEALIPKIPFIPGLRAKALNVFLLVTAQEVAAYKALSKLGKSSQEVWQLCHRALRLKTAAIPKWKKWILKRYMFSKLVRLVVERRAKRRQLDRRGEFEIEYVSSEGADFDLGINYRRCGNHQFAIEHGAGPFAPYICMSDIVLSDALGWGLTRTQTLADGCEYCDFRFKEGAATRITSKSPDVQEVIERIRGQEATQHEGESALR